MRWTVLAALLVTACASSASSSTSSSDPATAGTPPSTMALGSGPAGPDQTASPSADAEPAGVQPDGFDRALARTTLPDGTVCEFCVWVADTAPQRSRGLMYVTDLGAADAMAFRYPAPRTGTFWMKNTPLPLSIAFFSPDGGFLGSFDMDPCASDRCPNYRTPERFEIAVEVPQGDLAEFGLVDGSTFELLDLPCND